MSDISWNVRKCMNNMINIMMTIDTYLIDWSLVKSWMVRRSVWFGFGFNNFSDIYVPMCCADLTWVSATIFIIHTMYILDCFWFRTKNAQFQNMKKVRKISKILKIRFWKKNPTPIPIPKLDLGFSSQYQNLVSVAH